MKAIILAGGKGTRLSEYTRYIPKPMIDIGGIPILSHLIAIFNSYKFSEVIIAAGYKKKIISTYYEKKKVFKNIKVVDTGSNTMTGGRILRLKKFFKKDEIFLMTYGDGLCDINLEKLIKFHKKHKKIATVTAVRPPIRFGELQLKKNNFVKKFEEKPQLKSGWINGGFFILDYRIFDYIKNDQTLFEREPMENLAKNNNLVAYRYSGFWKCVDTLKDKIYLEKLYKKNKKIWKI